MDNQNFDIISSNILNISESNSCSQNALTDSYGWLIQGILASLAFGLLVVKRFCEPLKHRRSWLVWFYDTSKQGFGASIIHFANVFLAEEFMGDPCTWYIMSFLLDSTVGLIIVWIGIRFSIHIAKRKLLPTLLFGEYGRPPSAVAWIHQCFVYILIMIVEKLIITGLMGLPIWSHIRDLILSPFSSPKTKVAFSVLIVPFVVNAIIFWITDNILMMKVKRSDLPHGMSVASSSISAPSATNSLTNIRYKKKNQLNSSDESDGLISSPDEDLLGTYESLQSPNNRVNI